MRVDPEALRVLPLSPGLCALYPITCASLCLIVPSACQSTPSQCFADGPPYSPSKPSPLPMSGPEKDVPTEGPAGGWIDGKRRSRQSGPDGSPARDVDKPHQGAPYPHVHEWEKGKREHPGRPVTPLPKKD